MIATSVDPVSAAFLRFFIASIFLIFLTLKIEGRLPRIKPGDIILVFLLGLTGIFTYNICFFLGLKYIQANLAALIIALNPIFISLLSAVFFKEKLTAVKISGIALSVFGALWVISKGNPAQIFMIGPGKGEILIFGCVVSWVTYSLLGKKLMNRLSPIGSVCYSSVAGTVLLFFPALYFRTFQQIPGYGVMEWTSLFYLGFFGTVLGFFWYYQGIRMVGPMKAGIFINLVPVSAIILSSFILNEVITGSLICGAVLVICGVFLTTFKKQNT